MHSPNSHHSTRRQRGFSLIEVLIAILVLAIGLLGMANMQASGMRSTHGAYLRTQATFLAGDILDSMRANVTAARGGSYDIAFIDSENAVVVGAVGRILKTHEKYKNLWRIQDPGTTELLTCVSFIDDRNGWAGGYGGIVLHLSLIHI